LSRLSTLLPVLLHIVCHEVLLHPFAVRKDSRIAIFGHLTKVSCGARCEGWD
jgi:hypothetical protein